MICRNGRILTIKYQTTYQQANVRAVRMDLRRSLPIPVNRSWRGLTDSNLVFTVHIRKRFVVRPEDGDLRLSELLALELSRNHCPCVAAAAPPDRRGIGY